MQPTERASELPGAGSSSRLRDMRKAPVLRPGAGEPGDEAGLCPLAAYGLHFPAQLEVMWSADGRLAAGDRGQASESMSAMSIAVGRPDGTPPLLVVNEGCSCLPKRAGIAFPVPGLLCSQAWYPAGLLASGSAGFALSHVGQFQHCLSREQAGRNRKAY